MRPSLHCMAGDLLVREYIIHNFMIEETILYINVDEDEAEHTVQYSIKGCTSYKDVVSFPPTFSHVQTDEIARAWIYNHLCPITPKLGTSARS